MRDKQTHTTKHTDMVIKANVVITKRKDLDELKSSPNEFFYLVYGKIFHQNGHTYIPFKMVVWFDTSDIQNYFEKDVISKKDVKTYLDKLIETLTDYVHDWDNLDNFITYCNNSIETYNKNFLKKNQQKVCRIK